MSTTLLYHAFGIKGYQHISTKCRGGAQVALQHHLSARLSEIHQSGQFICYDLRSYHLLRQDFAMPHWRIYCSVI